MVTSGRLWNGLKNIERHAKNNKLEEEDDHVQYISNLLLNSIF